MKPPIARSGAGGRWGQVTGLLFRGAAYPIIPLRFFCPVTPFFIPATACPVGTRKVIPSKTAKISR